jgi:hypothetical protein
MHRCVDRGHVPRRGSHRSLPRYLVTYSILIVVALITVGLSIVVV